jgi:hypothetical protein
MWFTRLVGQMVKTDSSSCISAVLEVFHVLPLLIYGVNVRFLFSHVSLPSDLFRAFSAFSAFGGCRTFPPGTSLALWVRGYAEPRHQIELFQMLISAEIFWPRRAGNIYEVVVVLDDEDKRSPGFAAYLRRAFSYVMVYYEKPSDSYRTGYDRQQFSTFFADLQTNATFIAILDSDVLLTGVVTYGCLFDDEGRPYVKPTIGSMPGGGWSTVPANTQKWLGGKLEIMRGMAYFPVIIRRRDFAFIRETIEAIHKKPFNAVFKNLTRDYFSQFNIMLNLLFYLRPNSYAWRFRERYPFLQNLVKGQPSAAEFLELRRTHNMNPIVIPAVHVPYAPFSLSGWSASLEGFCYAVNFSNQQLCPITGNRNTIRRSLFLPDDGNSWMPAPRIGEAQSQYYNEFDQLHYLFTNDQVKMLEYGIQESRRKLDIETWITGLENVTKRDVQFV